MAILTEQKARNIKPTDRPIGDGTVSGLRLHPGKKKGHGKWLLRFVSPTKVKKKKTTEMARREMGLGSYPEVIQSELGTTPDSLMQEAHKVM